VDLKQVFDITPGAWSGSLNRNFSIARLIFTVRGANGERIDAGIPDDFAIDAGDSYPVRTKREIRDHMEQVFAMSGEHGRLDAPGGQPAGVFVWILDVPAGQEIHFHATWPDLVGNGTLEVMTLPPPDGPMG
jgi:hypothetical protein